MTPLYAWVNRDGQGGFAIIAVGLPGMAGPVPLCMTSKKLLTSTFIREVVRLHVAEHGQDAELIEYSPSKVLEHVPFNQAVAR